MPTGNSNRTISFWFYFSKNANSEKKDFPIISTTGDNCLLEQDFTILVVNETLYIDICNLNSFMFTDFKLIRNYWNFVVITFTNNQATVYINGINNQTIYINGLNFQPKSIFFGKRLINNQTVTANAGLLTDIRIWRKILTNLEIAIVFNSKPLNHKLVAAWNGITAQSQLKDEVGNLNGNLSTPNVITNSCNNGNSLY